MKVIYLVVFVLFGLAAASYLFGSDPASGVTQPERDASVVPVLRNLNLASLFQRN